VKKLSEKVDPKVKALAKYLDCDPEDISEGYPSYGDFMTLEYGSEEYLVLTDEEADEACKEYVKDSVWAFNASFIIQHSDLPWEAEEMIKGFQESKCEDANETILALITDFDEFVEDAISADGRGHFLSGYDGDEVEDGDYFIYRVN